MFLFSCIRPSPLKKKLHHIFIQQRKLQKKNVLASILALITSLLKSRELGQYFKNSKKNLFYFLNIRDYEFIRKTYSQYKKSSFLL